MGRTFSAFLAGILATFGVWGTSAQKRPFGEQLSFKEDGPLRNQVPLSPEVLKILPQTDEARDGLRQASPSERNNPERLFRASEVHLSRSAEIDVVVMGVGVMSGGDQSWFWVVRSERNNPTVVCFAGGNSLDLLNSRTNGYRDIESSWSSAAKSTITIYRFDGTQYKQSKTSPERTR
jgi:hypothetical protein